MIKYYLVKYKNINDNQKITKEIEVNTKYVEIESNFYKKVSFVNYEETLYNSSKSNNIKIFTIIEYNDKENRYFDIITGEEYTICDDEKYLESIAGNLELEIVHNISPSIVVNLLREINFSDDRVEAYTTTMKVLNKISINDKDSDLENEYYIESFKRRYRHK